MILPLYANLVKLDESLLEASADLGGRPLATFFHVTLPLSMPGVIAGFMLVFVPAIGEFVIPELLGGPDTLMIGRVLWNEFFSNRDWPVASRRGDRDAGRAGDPDHDPAQRPGADGGELMRASTLLLVFCILGFVFLYAPILSLIIFSFNESKLVTVWGGFSTKWYGELFEDPQILGAAWISLKVAVVTATLSVVLGTLAAYVLTRFGRFRDRALLTGMSTAPLVMPDVITGLSLLLLFVVDGAADRLAGRARHDHDHHRARHLLHGLCRRWWCSRGSPTWTRASRRRRWTSAPGRSGCSST